MPNFTKTIKKKVTDFNYFTLKTLIKQFLDTSPSVKKHIGQFHHRWHTCDETLENDNDYFDFECDDLTENQQTLLNCIGCIASSVFMLEFGSEDLYYEIKVENKDIHKSCEFWMAMCENCPGIHLVVEIRSTEEENPSTTQQEQQVDASENPV